MNKHTPGPWVNHGLAITSKAEWIAGNRTELEIATIHSETNPVSAEGRYQYPEPECADANARLIAAAPEMFDALLEAVLIARAYRSLCCKQFGAQPAGLDESMQMISHALAKVKPK